MKNRYRTSAHSRYTIFYHFAFCPKYRREIFQDQDIDKAAAEIKKYIKEQKEHERQLRLNL